MIPDDLLDQLNKLKYLERTTNQIKEFTDQVMIKKWSLSVYNLVYTLLRKNNICCELSPLNS